jgi:peroxiredoxin
MSDQDIAALYMSAEGRWMDRFLEGPTHVSEPLRRGQRAPDLDLIAEDGSAVPLSSVWAERPALICLWRHLGCGCGMDRAERLKKEKQSYVDAGLAVVVVAPAEPQRVAVYKEKYGLNAPTLADPTYATHRAFGLSHWSVEQVLYDAPDEVCELDPAAGQELQDSRRADGRPLVDDPWMQSAEFVVGTDGVIHVAYYYNYCEDFPDPRIFITAARMAPAG